MMRNFKSLMTMFTPNLSASSQDPVGQGDTPLSERIPVPLDERKVSEAYDLVEAELLSPTFRTDYAHFVSYDDFPDENGCELVFLGLVAEHVCKRLSLTQYEVQTVKCRFKMMYLDVLRKIEEEDALNAAKDESDSSTGTSKPKWLLKLKRKFTSRLSSSEDFNNTTAQSDDIGDAALGEQVRSAQRIREKMNRIGKRFKGLSSLSRRLVNEDESSTLFFNHGSTSRVVSNDDKRDEETCEDDDRGDHSSPKASGENNAMTWNWRQILPKKRTDQRLHASGLVGTAKFNYPKSELSAAVKRDDRLQVVAHDNDEDWLLVKSLSSGELSFVPVHIVELDTAGEMSLQKALKYFNIPTRFEHWQRENFLQESSKSLNNGKRATAFTETTSSTYGFTKRLSRKLFTRKISARQHQRDRTQIPAKPEEKNTWFKFWTGKKDVVNDRCVSHDSQNSRLDSGPKVRKRDAWKLRLTSIFKRDQTTEASLSKGLNGKVAEFLEKKNTISLKPKKRWVVKMLIRRTFSSIV